MNDWRSQAACQGMGASAFYAEPGETLKIQSAKAVCDNCAVREPCLTAAVTRGENWGVWGATSPEDRRAIRRQAGLTKRRGAAA
jgi:WhiB family redox-sensing transcriptional regulator